MNILLINHYAGSPIHGMEFRPYYLAREWMSAGHTVQIIGGSFSHIRANQPAVLVEKKIHQEVNGVDYLWYRTPYYFGNGFGRVKSIFSFIWNVWRDARKIVNDFKPDVVIASSTYPMDIWPSYRIAKLAKAKLIYEVHDLWPLSPMELGGMSKWHPFIMWVQKAEDFAYKNADSVVSMLPKAFDYMSSRGLNFEKFSYIPNGVDVSEWDDPDELPDFVGNEINKIRKKNIPLVGYAGTFGLANALDVFLDASKFLIGKVNFVLVGTGPEYDKLQKRILIEKLENVSIFQSVPKQAVPNLLKLFDIAYIGLLSQPLFRFGISPNKLIDYMMAGKPIIMSIKSGNDPVAEAGCGLTVSPDDPLAVANGLLQLSQLTSVQRQEMGRKGQDFVRQNHVYPVLARRFIDAMNHSPSAR
jgi:glycosyltransferase involved in cell wall biosynthesis